MSQLAYLLLLVPLAAAGPAWWLARRQGRRAGRWAVWTLALGGLPLLWLTIEDIFGLPKATSQVRYRCCAGMTLAPVADLGHAASCDFELDRCVVCAAYVMAVDYYGAVIHVVIRDDRAKRFLALRGKPELKRALKAWID